MTAQKSFPSIFKKVFSTISKNFGKKVQTAQSTLIQSNEIKAPISAIFPIQEQKKDDLLKKYLKSLSNEHCSSATIRNYRSDIQQFFEFVDDDSLEKILKKAKLNAFLSYQKQKGLKESSIKRKLASITQFSLWIQKHGQKSDIPEETFPQNTTIPPQENQPTSSISLQALETPSPKALENDTLAPALDSRKRALNTYLLAVQLTGCSSATIKNYRSDINQFFEFDKESTLEKSLVKPKIEHFASMQAQKGLKEASILRKLTSLTHFGLWAKKQGYDLDVEQEWPQFILQKLFFDNKRPTSQDQEKERSLHHLLKKIGFEKNKKKTRNQVSYLDEVSKRHPSKAWAYFNLSATLLFMLGLGYFGYQQFNQVDPSLAFPTSLTRPDRILSFQGRLTDSAQNPLTSATNLRFRLYDSLDSGGSNNLLWDSNTCSITPDQDGIFASSLGAGSGAGADTEDCGAEIADSVFTENSNVWLEVQVVSETLTPRQPIRTVAYAVNAETLQGYPASASAVENTVLIMDNNGEVVLGNSNPKIKSTGDSFTLEGNSVTLQSASGSSGNIVFNADGVGGIIAQDAFFAPNATFSANYAGGKALVAKGGPSGTANIQEWQNAAGTALTVIDESGNLGIGSTNPTASFSVGSGNEFTLSSAGAITAATGITSSGTVTFSGLSTDGVVTVTSGVLSSIAQGSGGGLDADTLDSLDSLQFLRSDTSDTFTSGTLAFDDSTVLAIGTGADLQFTHNGTNTTITSTTGNLLIDNTNTTGSTLFQLGTDTTATDFQILNNSGTSLFEVDGSGNVGIGNTAPLAKLDVAGNASASGNLTLAGGARSIQSTSLNTLTIGGSTTGNIDLSASNILRFNDAYVAGASDTTPISFSDSSSTINTFRTNFTNESIIGAINETLASVTNVWTRSGENLSPLNFGDTVTLGDYFAAPGATLSATVATNVPLAVKGATSQTGDLTQWQNVGGTVLSVLDANGNLGLGATSTSGYRLYVSGDQYSTGDVAAGGGDFYDDSGDVLLKGEDSVHFGIDYTANDTTSYFSWGKDTALGTAATGTNELMRLNNDGNLGIGDSTPDAFLDITGTTNQLRLSYETGDTNYANFTLGSSGDLLIDPTGGDLTLDGNFLPNTDNTYLLGRNSQRWFDLFLGTGTAHIGTSTTDEGTIAYNTSTNVFGFTNNFGDTDFSTSTDGFNFTLGGGAGDDFIVDGTTFVIESDTNNVGIGTSTPADTFQIVKDGSGLSVLQDSYTAANGAARTLISLRKSRGSVATPTTVLVGDSLGGIAFSGHDGTDFVLPAVVEAFVDDTVSTGSVPARLGFVTGTSFGTRTEKMSVSSDGKVGIGNTDPTYSLDVNGDARIITLSAGSTDTVVTHATGRLQTRTIDSRVWGATLTDGSGTASYIPRWSDGDSLTNSIMYDNGTNIGIGTSSTSRKLHVSGDAYITGDGNGDYDSPDLLVGSAEGNIRLGAQDSVSGYQIYTSDAYEGQLVVQTEVNPDGTDDEYELFSVRSSGLAERFSVIHGATGYASQFYDSLAIGVAGDNSPTVGHVDLGLTSSGDLFVQDDVEIDGQIFVDGTGNNYFAGNIGIGNSSPAALLDINTTSTTTGIALDGNIAISGYSGDNYLRLNQSSSFSSGVYTPGNLRTDGAFQVGSAGSDFNVANGGDTSVGVVDGFTYLIVRRQNATQEGGNITLNPGGSYTSDVNMDSYQNDFRVWNAPATTSQASFFNTATSQVMNVITDGSASDYAETIYSGESMSGGDIVIAQAAQNEDGVIAFRSNQKNDPLVVGVVSTAPGTTLKAPMIEAETGKIIRGTLVGKYTDDVRNLAPYLAPLALSGRVPVKVTTTQKPIRPGKSIVSSNKKGIGQEADEPGISVGKTITSFDPANMSCTSVNSLADIRWPADPEGNNAAKPCFRLPDGSYVGKVMIMVGNHYINPDIKITSTGGITIEKDQSSPDKYNIASSNGTISQVTGIAQAFIANIEAGLTKTKTLVVQNSASINTLSANNISVGGSSLSSYISSIVNNILSNTSFPQSESPTDTTTLISPIVEDLSVEGNLTAQEATVEGKIIALDLETTGKTKLAELSVSGKTSLGELITTESATISGNLTVAQSASVAGTLTAQKIEVKGALNAQELNATNSRLSYLEGEIAKFNKVEAQTAEIVNATISGTLYANDIANFDEKVAKAFRQPSLLGTLLSQDESFDPLEGFALETPLASSSAQFDKKLVDLNVGVNDIVISPAAAFIDQYLRVNGNSFISGSLALGQSLLIGSGNTLGESPSGQNLILGQNTLESLSHADPSQSILNIQPSGKGTLSLMAGLMTLTEDGTVTISGNLKVAGAFDVNGTVTAQGDVAVKNSLLSNLIEPLNPEASLQLKLSQTATDSADVKQSRFEIVDELGSPVATISASGRATFDGGLSINTENLNDVPSNATNSAELTATQTAGRAKLPANTKTLTIKSSRITQNTLIYVTPLGSTSNQVLYVKSQVADNPQTPEIEGKFEVGFDQALPEAVNFNWWLVN